MKGNNFSKKFNGQIQTMGKGGIKDISNTNAIQPNPNYNPQNMNYGNQFNPMYQMNQNQMYQNQMPMMQQQNPYNNQMMMYNNNNYQGFNNNGMGMPQNINNYENSKNKNNNINNNNPMVRNAKMILDNNNLGNKNMRQKSKSARKVTDISKSNDIGYQGGQGSYNNAPMNNYNNYNMGMNNMNNNLYGNNNGFQMMNNPPQMYNQINNQYNNMNNKNNGSAKTPNMKKRIQKENNDYQYMEFHPYTLKDYKELTRNPVVMGPLGANIGTKEWEIKRNKMKKMQTYSNNINKEHKGITSLKKDTPKDEIEKLTKQKIEKSIRHRAYEYGKLVRAGKFKDENENIGKNDNLGVIPENDDDLYLKKYEDQLRQETENMNNPKPKEPIVPVVEENNDKEDLLDIDQLLKQKEDYKAKIQGIRDTLLD